MSEITIIATKFVDLIYNYWKDVLAISKYEKLFRLSI